VKPLTLLLSVHSGHADGHAGIPLFPVPTLGPLQEKTIAIVVFIEFDCDDIIRFISARRANKHEIKIFKQEIKNQLG